MDAMNNFKFPIFQTGLVFSFICAYYCYILYGRYNFVQFVIAAADGLLLYYALLKTFVNCQLLNSCVVLLGFVIGRHLRQINTLLAATLDAFQRGQISAQKVTQILRQYRREHSAIARILTITNRTLASGLLLAAIG